MAVFQYLLCLLLVVVGGVHSKSAEEWKSRVIYQVLTDRFSGGSGSDLSNYCGGTFKGITQKLDYIQQLGANAIWISPIPENTDGGYHGYWQKNLFSINSHFGTSSDLKELVSACHSRDIWVMLDVVGNHFGKQKNGNLSYFSDFVPFNSSDHFHPYCLIKDFSNQHEVEVCRLDNLPDLDQSNSFVRSTILKWIHDTVSTYGFDGIRVDTTPEVPKDFWADYSRSAGVFSIGEVDNGDPAYNAGYQGALDATLNYPMFYKLVCAFAKCPYTNPPLDLKSNIQDGLNQSKRFHDASVLATFVDNHDNPRFLSQNSDRNVLKNAMAYVIFAEGIPIIYYGTEQGFSGDHDPVNRETMWGHYDTSNDLFQAVSAMAKFRTSQGPSLYQSPQVERYADKQFYAFTRGMVFVAVSNIGSGQSLSRSITFHPYKEGQKLVNVLDSSDTATVNGGSFTVNIQNGLPKVYHPMGTAQLEPHAYNDYN